MRRTLGTLIQIIAYTHCKIFFEGTHCIAFVGYRTPEHNLSDPFVRTSAHTDYEYERRLSERRCDTVPLRKDTGLASLTRPPWSVTTRRLRLGSTNP